MQRGGKQAFYPACRLKRVPEAAWKEVDSLEPVCYSFPVQATDTGISSAAVGKMRSLLLAKTLLKGKIHHSGVPWQMLN